LKAQLIDCVGNRKPIVSLVFHLTRDYARCKCLAAKRKNNLFRVLKLLDNSQMVLENFGNDIGCIQYSVAAFCYIQRRG
jgi:hypothetical protein